MDRRTSIALLLILPAFAGCSPDGPPEFYRTARQARSELVDSLSEIVDDQSAGHVFKKHKKKYEERMESVRRGFSTYRNISDPLFMKLLRDNFQASHINATDTAMMKDAIRANLEHIDSTAPTLIRQDREVARLQMIGDLLMLEKARKQMESRAQPDVSTSSCAPNIQEIVEFFIKVPKTDPDMNIVPVQVKLEQLKKFDPSLPEADAAALVNRLKSRNRNGGDAIKAPPLPPYPPWAEQVDKQGRLNIIPRTRWGQLADRNLEKMP